MKTNNSSAIQSPSGGGSIAQGGLDAFYVILWIVFLVLFIIDLLIPDPIPLLDEVILFLAQMLMFSKAF